MGRICLCAISSGLVPKSEQISLSSEKVYKKVSGCSDSSVPRPKNRHLGGPLENLRRICKEINPSFAV
jgi:hypothetical protein